MATVTRIYEDEEITIKVTFDGYEFAFSLITSDSETAISKRDLEEETANEYFKRAVTSYITTGNAKNLF